jgi:hypothetical protein
VTYQIMQNDLSPKQSSSRWISGRVITWV